MGLLIGFIVVLVWGFLANSEFSLDWLWQILAVLFFYWLGTFFASPMETISHLTLATIIAGVCYTIAGIIAVLRVLAWFGD